MSRLNRRGPRERSLFHALRKKYGAIAQRLALEVRRLRRKAGLRCAAGEGCQRRLPVVIVARHPGHAQLRLDSALPTAALLPPLPTHPPTVPHPQAQAPMEYRLEAIARPQPLMPDLPQPAVAALEAQVAAGGLAEARDRVDGFLHDAQAVKVRGWRAGGWMWSKRERGRRGVSRGCVVVLPARGCVYAGAHSHPSIPAPPPPPSPLQLEIDGDLAELQAQLAGCADAPALCQYLLRLEAVLCHAGEGLPRGEDAPVAAGGPQPRAGPRRRACRSSCAVPAEPRPPAPALSCTLRRGRGNHGDAAG